MTLLERFEAKYIPEPNTGCWLWTGAQHRFGYGQININHKLRMAHRVSHELFSGPIPAGFQIDHLCRQPACVNPKHLEAVTPRENFHRSHNANVKLYLLGVCQYCGRKRHPSTFPSRGNRMDCRPCRLEKDRNRKRAAKLAIVEWKERERR